MTDFVLILLAIAIAFSGLTWLLNKRFHHRLVKYAPATLALGIGLQNFYLARFAPSEGFKDLARLVVVMMAIVAFVASLATALYIDYRHAKQDGNRRA